MMSDQPLRVTVFGGSKPIPGSDAYARAERLGHLLGKAGLTVLTGGYIGTMEAVSRGANLAGGHVIGVTCDQIEEWRPVKPNRWVQEELRFSTLRDRLYALIEHCDAAIALPGGIGTLAEIAVMWSQLQVGASPPKPLILVGRGWQSVIDSLDRELNEYIAPGDRAAISLARDVESAAALLLEE